MIDYVYRKLRRPIASIIGLVLLGTGMVSRRVKKTREQNLIALIYFHNPSAKLFEKCIKWLIKKGYCFVSVDELYGILVGEKNPPRGAVCLSFDDGWRTNLSNIIPVANVYDVPVCFFISTEPAENGVFWWTYVSKFLEMSCNDAMSAKDYKAIPESDRQKRINELKTRLCLKREAMTEEEILEISSIPLVTIASHTVNHACLNRCTEAELWYEITESKRLLSKWTKKEVKYFSYPNGDLKGVEHTALSQSGYLMAFTARPGFVDLRDRDLFYLPRFCLNDQGSLAENICKMTGLWQNTVGRVASKISLGLLQKEHE